MITGAAPYTGFGNDPEAAISFHIVSETGVFPDWSGGPRLTEKVIGNRVVVRNMGRNPYRVTFRLELPDRRALAALDAAQGTVATLRYPYGVTRELPGSDHELIGGWAYLVIPGVRLLTIGDDVLIQPDGIVEVSATFLKPWEGA